MKIILNGANGEYLSNILEFAAHQFSIDGGRITERVEAAVAYANDSTLFDWCWDRKIPLRFWGRYDTDGIPISLPILDNFLKRKSANYSCRLVRHFHPKVIWWHGLGAYIGSANLSQRAWFNNFEAGVFFDELELVGTGQYEELTSFFEMINKNSSPLTEEVFEHLKLRSQTLERIQKQNIDLLKIFSDTDYVYPWDGLGYISSNTSATNAKISFLQEWTDTLQIIRNIAKKICLPENRPVWVDELSPSGTQADQFLHAHYYQNTFENGRANFEFFFEKNKLNPEKAVENAVAWWRLLPNAPNHEDRMINEWAPFLRKSLAPDSILNIDEQALIGIMSKIHAAIEYARRVPNNSVGLPSGRQYSMQEKIEALAKQIYRYQLSGGTKFAETWNYVLYGGSSNDLPNRMWTALHDPKYRIENFGISAMGELVGWALPDTFPPRNGRTSKALRSLGFDVRVHV